MKSISIDIKLRKQFGEALQAIKDAMKAEGFGVLSEIDVQATLKEKIGVDIEPYTILGVCNPSLAAKAISIEPKVGIFLPCTILIRRSGPDVLVSAQDPVLMEELLDTPSLYPVGQEARSRIAGVLDQLQKADNL